MQPSLTVIAETGKQLPFASEMWTVRQVTAFLGRVGDIVRQLQGGAQEAAAVP